MAPVTHKRCRRCKKSKEVRFFYKDKTNTDGYRSYCKSCGKTMSEEYAAKSAKAKPAKKAPKAAAPTAPTQA